MFDTTVNISCDIREILFGVCHEVKLKLKYEICHTSTWNERGFEGVTLGWEGW